MVLKGHVNNGVIILDDEANLPDGTVVFISLEPVNEEALPYRRYRGSPYTYTNPTDPAAPDSDWDAAR